MNISQLPVQEPLAAQPFLPRPSLVAQLAAAGSTLVLLAAPAGSGKSMALLAFARAQAALGHGCHWINLAALTAAPPTGTLLIDLDHWPEDPAAQTILMAALHSRLSRQRVYLALAGPLPQPLRDEWIAGRAQVFGARDLLFDADEAVALFGATSATREVHHLQQFTQGWPLGLGLLSRDPEGALALMRREGARQPLPRSLTLWFDDWLDRSVDATGQGLLMDLAVFERFPAALLQNLPCPDGHTATLAPLAPLLEAGLFVQASESRPGWFSLMPVLARYLRDRLTLRQPERATQIRRFALDWAASGQDSAEQLRHGLAIWSPDEALAGVDATGAIVASLSTGPDIELDHPILAANALTAPLTFFGMVYERIRLGAFDEARVHYENAVALTEDFRRVDAPQDPDEIRRWIEVLSAVIQISADTPIDAAWRAALQAELRDEISRNPVLAMAQSTVTMLMALNAGEREVALSISRLALQLQERSRADKAAIFVNLHRASALIASARLGEARDAIQAGQRLAADHTYADSYELISCQIHAGLCAYEAGEAETAFTLLEPCYTHFPRIHGWRRNWLDYFSALAELGAQQSKGGAALWLERGQALAKERNQPHLALGLELCQLDLLLQAGQIAPAVSGLADLSQRLNISAYVPQQISHWAGLFAVDLLLAQGDIAAANTAFAALNRPEISAHDLRLDLRATGIELDLSVLTQRLDGVQVALIHAVALAQDLPRLARQPQLQTRLRRACDMALGQGIELGREVSSFCNSPGGRGRSLLSPREGQIIGMIAEGLSNKEIARLLGTSEGTVKSHRKNLYEKLDVSSRSKAIARAKALGLVKGD